MAAETKPYVLNEGKTHVVRNAESGRAEKKGEGDIVYLNAHQARAFADKFEPASDADVDTAAAAAEPVVVDVSDPDEPVLVEPGVEPNTMNAKDTVAAMRAASTADEVEALAGAEEARSDGGRQSVLDAADKALDAFEEE